MKVSDYLKSHTADEIASFVAEGRYKEEALSHDDWRCVFEPEYFDDSSECPGSCEYLCDGYTYEDSWMNGMCSAEHCDEPCPYNIDRKEVFKKKLIEWLNMEISDDI